MIIPKYNKNINRYALTFLDDFYASLACLEEVSDLNLKERNIINDVLTRYYCVFFTLMHQDNKKLMHHPELATSFNFLFGLLATEATIIYFFTYPDPPLSDIRKKISFETLVKRMGFKLHNLKQEDLTDGEIYSKLVDYIYDKHIELFEKEYSFSPDFIPSRENKLRKFCSIAVLQELYKSKFDEIRSSINKIFNFDNHASFWITLLAIVPFSLLFFFIPLGNLWFKSSIIHVPLVTFFYIAFFSMFGYMLFVCYRAKKKLDILEEYESYYSKYQRLGVDVLSVYISKQLLNYVDDERQNRFLPIIADFRLNLLDDYGLVLPMIRVMDKKDLEDYKIIVRVRNNEVAEFNFYPDRFVISEKDLQILKIKIPKTSVKMEYDGKVYYWIKDKFFKNIEKDAYMTREEFIKYVLNDITFKYIYKIFTLEETFCLLELIKNKEDELNIYNLSDFNIADFREIFVKILQKGGSLKDITYVFERIIYYSNSSKDKDFIAFSVCQDLVFKK